MRRWPGSVALGASLILLATGSLVAALSTRFVSLLGGVFFIGVAFGGLDFLLNALLVRTDLDGRAHRLSVANAGYGVGAVVGPLLIIGVRPGRFPWILAAIAVSSLLLTASTRGLRAPPLRSSLHVRHGTHRRAVLTTFVGAYVLYVATEASLSGWIAPQLHRIGYSQTIGSATTAGFWLGLAVGRFLAGPIHRRVNDRALVLSGLSVTVLLCMLAQVDALAPFVYPLAGFSMALVYPMGLIWYTRLAPGDNDGIALMIFMMMSGGIIGPAVTSALVSAFGVHVVPISVSVFAIGDLAVFASARRFQSRGEIVA